LIVILISISIIAITIIAMIGFWFLY
jgi:hypothetical protein